MDPKVILEAVLSQEEISSIETLILLREEKTILPELVRVADTLNQRMNTKVVTYVKSKQIHYTNVCKAECSFCSFYKKKGQKNAFALKPTEIVKQIRDAGVIKQVVLSGGLNPDLNMAYHQDVLRSIRSAYPNLHVHGYSPSEIQFIAKRGRTTSSDVLKRLLY